MRNRITMLAEPAAIMAVNQMMMRQHAEDPDRFHARHPGRSKVNPHLDCGLCGSAARAALAAMSIQDALDDDEGSPIEADAS